MTVSLYLPIDLIEGREPDFDLTADFLELSAFFSNGSRVLTSSLANGVEIAMDDPVDLDAEMRGGVEEVVTSTVKRIETRQQALGSAYPYELDRTGDILTCTLDDASVGQAAYISCLVLSNLRPISPVLNSSPLHPDEAEIKELRKFFQYFATAALGAEIQGPAWSFGFPRPDHSSFFSKLEEIWQIIRDGRVVTQVGAPTQPKDDQVDVFAARPHPDQLPGFLLATAQVATGNNWRSKPLKGHISAFKSRWFGPQPVTDFITYMIIPFARPNEKFIDDVRIMGNVLHRVRVPRKVEEAKQLFEAGIAIEAYEQLNEAVQWVANYRSRSGALS